MSDQQNVMFEEVGNLEKQIARVDVDFNISTTFVFFLFFFISRKMDELCFHKIPISHEFQRLFHNTRILYVNLGRA